MTIPRVLRVLALPLSFAACDPRCDDGGALPPDAGPPPGATVHVIKSGDGTGTVRSDPEGVDCGTTCEDQILELTTETTTLTLSAEAARDALFESWTCTATKAGEPLPQVVQSEADIVAFDDEDPAELDVECTARFRQLHTLLVIFAGEGSGRVTGTAPAPEGGLRIDCPPKCTAGYFAGESETLTPIADPGSVFTGWTIACAGAGDATVVLDADKNCEARFELE